MASTDTTRLDEKPESSTDSRDGSDVPTSTAASSASEFSGEDLIIR